MRLGYWVKTAFQSAGAIIAGAAMYTVMMYAMGMEGGFQQLLSMAAVYLMLFGAGMSLLYGVTVYKLHLPLAVSFGSTRKEAAVGLQCYRLIFTGLIAAAATILWLLSGEDGFGSAPVFIPVGVTVLLIAGAVGTVLGVVSARFGRVAVIVTSLLTVLLIAGGVFATILFLLTAEGEILFPQWSWWVMPLAGIVLHLLSMIPERRMVYKYNVKL